MNTAPKIKRAAVSKYKSKHMFVDKKRKIYCDDSDDEDEQKNPNFPAFPDISELMAKTEKKKVFRDHNHIYFRCDVTMERVNKLCNLIEEYNREQETLRSELTTMIVIPKPIYLHITSYGGDLLGGLLAFDYIKNSKIPIYTIAEGYTVSSGANMFMAGHKRFMTENSYVLVHQLNNSRYGRESFHDMMDEASNVIEFMAKLYGIFLNNIRHNRANVPSQDILTKEKLENHMLHDIYWNYETCKRYGLVDELYTNYTDTDVSDVQKYLNNNMNQKGNTHLHQSKIYSLEDLKPSDVIIQKVKNNLEEQKNADMIEMVRKHLNKTQTTSSKNGLLNANDENSMIQPDNVINEINEISDPGVDITPTTKKITTTRSKKK